jgi:microcystin-dependent protein
MLLLNRFIESDGDIVHFTVKVGIGTTTPTKDLDVVGDMRLLGDSSVSGDATFTGRIVADTTSEITMPESSKIKIDTVPLFDIITMCSPPGTIIQFAGTTSPDGYVLCDGQTYNVTQYPRLYAAIGKIWNPLAANGTFSVPNLLARFLRNNGGNAGAVGNRQADAIRQHQISGNTADGGNHSHGGSTGRAGNHSHSVEIKAYPGGTFFGGKVANTARDKDAKTANQSTNSQGEHSHNLSISNGGIHSHSVTLTYAGGVETCPIFATVLFCIKT